MHAHCSLIHKMVHTLSLILCDGVSHDLATLPIFLPESLLCLLLLCDAAIGESLQVFRLHLTGNLHYMLDNQQSARAFRYFKCASLLTCNVGRNTQ